MEAQFFFLLFYYFVIKIMETKVCSTIVLNPDGIYRIDPSFFNTRSTVMFFFLGFYFGDGMHLSGGTTMGISLRSTSALFLYKLLIKIGVTMIHLRFGYILYCY